MGFPERPLLWLIVALAQIRPQVTRNASLSEFTQLRSPICLSMRGLSMNLYLVNRACYA